MTSVGAPNFQVYADGAYRNLSLSSEGSLFERVLSVSSPSSSVSYVSSPSLSSSVSYNSSSSSISSSSSEDSASLDGEYVYTSTYGTATATYSVDQFGKIAMQGGHNQTANLFYEDAILAVGDTVSVMMVDAPPTDTYLTISTANRAPNITGESGIRLRWDADATFTARNYLNGVYTNVDFDQSFNATGYVTLYIKRETATTFSASFDDGSGKLNLNTNGGSQKQTLTINGLSSDSLFVGVETYHSGYREFEDFGTENLGTIIPSSSVASTPSSSSNSQPFALNGYYPLYFDAPTSNGASPVSSSHSHTIGGVTYWMPSGVTNYHGDYVEP